MKIFMLFKTHPQPLLFKKEKGSNCAALLNFSVKIICLIFFCDDWRNLRENYFARLAVDFGCGFAALVFQSILSKGS
ncbi:hypothetical protein ACX8XP_14150 [Calditrichota bacterium LG25]